MTKKSFYYRCKGDDKIEGPFKSITAVRKAILENAKECFDTSCNCLKRDFHENWFDEIEVFERVYTVKPIVKSMLTLQEVQP